MQHTGKSHTYHFDVVQSNLNTYKKGVHYTLMKLFNNLPSTIKSISHKSKQPYIKWGIYYLTPTRYKNLSKLKLLSSYKTCV